MNNDSQSIKGRFPMHTKIRNAAAFIVSFGGFAFGFNGLTLFVETPWFDASVGRYGPDLLIHG
jgi:hypothetical protein